MELAEGLAHLHHEGILHRDLKAANILLDGNGRAKLADLGVAQVDALLQAEEALVVAIGLQDKRFMAPENVKDQSLSSKATDIYALGLVLWAIASGKEPRKLEDIEYRRDWELGKHTEREPIPQDCRESFQELILACWQTDPKKRPHAQALVGSLAALEGEYNPTHHVFIQVCEKLKKLIHPRRQEGLSYIAPFVTAHRVEERIESYWTRMESATEKGEKVGNQPLNLQETF